jgi:hypothetical protein
MILINIIYVKLFFASIIIQIQIKKAGLKEGGKDRPSSGGMAPPVRTGATLKWRE